MAIDGKDGHDMTGSEGSALVRRREHAARLLHDHRSDALVATSPGAIAHLTGIDVRGFTAGRKAAVLRADASVTLVTSEADRASVADAGGDGTTFHFSSAGRAAADDALTEALNHAGVPARVAVERPGDLVRGVDGALAGIDAGQTFVCEGAPVLDAATRVKDDDEVALLREAANLADIAYTATVDRLHPELRVYDIVRNVDRSVRGAGGGGWWSPAEAEDDLLGMPAFPRGAVVALLDRQPETGVLDVEAPLPFQLHPLAHCYTGAAGTTVLFTRPEAALRDAAARLSEGLQAGIDALAPGARGSDVHRAFAGAAGETAGASLVGYSVGTGPGPVVVSASSEDALEPGMALCLRATATTAPGSPSVFFQTTVLVTPHGAERLDVVVPLRLIELH